MQVNLIFILTGQTASGEQEVLGAFDRTGDVVDFVNGYGVGHTSFAHGEPFTSFAVKPTVEDAPQYGGDTRSLQWNEGSNDWGWA